MNKLTALKAIAAKITAAKKAKIKTQQAIPVTAALDLIQPREQALAIQETLLTQTAAALLQQLELLVKAA